MKLSSNEARGLMHLDMMIKAEYQEGKILRGFKNLEVEGYKYGDIQVPVSTDEDTCKLIVDSYKL